jgi:hypothetical protein
MKQSENRRSFLFGVGAFAAAVFIPKAPKLIFPIQNSPLITPSSFNILRMWKDTNRTGSKTAYYWMGAPLGQPLRLYVKHGGAPTHLFDFDHMVKNTDPARDFSYHADDRLERDGIKREYVFAPGMWHPKKKMTPLPKEDFKSKVFQLEKHFDSEA